MNTFILIVVTLSSQYQIAYKTYNGGAVVAMQEFNSLASCEAAGAFAIASSEELNEANSARYKCIAK